jgi:hypothetical protein
MRITRIDIEGKTGRYATISRKLGSRHVDVRVLTPDLPEGKDHAVDASSTDDAWSMAECLIWQLEGCRGTNSMINDYYRQIERLMD